MIVQPVGDRVLVLPDPPETEFVQGQLRLTRPEQTREKPSQGKILYVGDGPNVGTRLAVGSTVLYGKFSGSEIEVDGQEYTVLQYEEILGILSLDGEMEKWPKDVQAEIETAKVNTEHPIDKEAAAIVRLECPYCGRLVAFGQSHPCPGQVPNREVTWEEVKAYHDRPPEPTPTPVDPLVIITDANTPL